MSGRIFGGCEGSRKMRGENLTAWRMKLGKAGRNGNRRKGYRNGDFCSYQCKQKNSHRRDTLISLPRCEFLYRRMEPRAPKGTRRRERSAIPPRGDSHSIDGCFLPGNGLVYFKSTSQSVSFSSNSSAFTSQVISVPHP